MCVRVCLHYIGALLHHTRGPIVRGSCSHTRYTSKTHTHANSHTHPHTVFEQLWSVRISRAGAVFSQPKTVSDSVAPVCAVCGFSSVPAAATAAATERRRNRAQKHQHQCIFVLQYTYIHPLHIKISVCAPELAATTRHSTTCAHTAFPEVVPRSTLEQPAAGRKAHRHGGRRQHVRGAGAEDQSAGARPQGCAEEEERLQCEGSSIYTAVLQAADVLLALQGLYMVWIVRMMMMMMMKPMTVIRCGNRVLMCATQWGHCTYMHSYILYYDVYIHTT